MYGLKIVRRRLERWEATFPVGQRDDRLERGVRKLATLASPPPPRVVYARTEMALNSRLTARRFQKQSGCCLGCPGDDSIEHYASCGCYYTFARRYVVVRRPPCYPVALEEFAGLGSLCSSVDATDGRRGLVPEEYDALRACAVYALMRTHNAFRHGLATSVAAEAFRGFACEAVRGSPRLAGLSRRRFYVGDGQ